MWQSRLEKSRLDLDWEILPHPPYSHDLAPTDHHLFRSLSNSLRGKEFEQETDIVEYLTDFFRFVAKRIL